MKQKAKTLLTSIISVMLAVIMVTGVAPLVGLVPTASAETSYTSGIYTYEITNGEVTITGCDSSATGDITIPSTLGGYPVTVIGYAAFAWCNGITSLTIPNSVTSIGNGAFALCKGLKSIIVDSENKYYSSADGVLFDKEQTTLIQYPTGSTRENYTIPNSVTTISEDAFVCCESLTNVIIGSGVAIIKGSDFAGCVGLINITVDSGNQYYSSVDGVLFDKAKTTLILYPIGSTRTSYTIPHSVITIGKNAFYGCSNLSSVIIPDGVVTIGISAFFCCNGLTNVIIPNSVTTIEHGAFSNCDGLINVEMGSSVTDIGELAFGGCTSLTSLTISKSVTSIGSHSFGGCNSLTDVYYISSEEDWNKITIDDGNDPLLNATIHYNWTGESPNISMPQTVKDESSGIEISAPSGAYEGTLELEIKEVFDGESYNVVSAIDVVAQNKVYDITTKVDGEPSQPGKAVTVRIPLPEGYDPDRTYVYHVNSETGEVENMNARYEDGCLVFETDHFSVYAVVEMEEERSFFGKVIDVLLGIVSLPVKLIVGLFKLIIGLFK